MKPENQCPLLQARSVDFSHGSRQVLHQISFSLPSPGYISVIGPNGSGKTTLFNLLCGSTKPQAGQVLYGEDNVFSMEIRQRAGLFAVLHQNESTDFPFTCEEIVTLGLHPHRTRFSALTQAEKDHVAHVMALTDTTRFAQNLITRLSGGEVQRVMLARALAQKPKVLFMDESMSDMDIRVKIELIKIIKSLVKTTGLTAVAVNHDLSVAYRFSDYVIALKEGRLQGQGTPKEVMTHEFLAQTFSVDVEIVEGKGLLIHDTL